RKEKLDIYYPEVGEGPYPMFIEIHGGAWYFGQKRSVEFEPFLLGRERGFACISLEYTMSPEGHYPLPIIEIKSAIRFLKKNAEQYNLDPNKVVVWGGSAGAHLAGLAATSCDTGYLEEDINHLEGISAKPEVLILWYGCFDYYRNGRYLEDWIYQNFFGTEDLESVKGQLEMSSPLAHITENICPTMIQHGLQDSIVPYTQSLGYFEKIREMGAEKKCCFELLPECEHADAVLFSEKNVSHMFDYIEKVLE
ncbi:MAG: alpha/beta hydrolase fold domain-containing protein, partial [Muricoprocola sp.]